MMKLGLPLFVFVMAIFFWVLSIRSIMKGRNLLESIDLRRERHPLFFWSLTGFQNILFGFLIVASLREALIILGWVQR